MNITITQLYTLLSEKVGKETAESLTTYIEAKIEHSVVDKTQHLASKADLANAKTDMIKWFVGLFLTLALMIIGLYLKL
ncbi:hypothetical protein FW774_09335 [Pedobacter sp. BS3]|uniref:hypothetical protein n=1 Tax=Pedobacter sp. BS3 TaxID=2567937 RepID=UPI0011EBC0C2|nr:hypothetical protein [Pedobacter sp. BS3]TZF83667.1 hypothetical protein FW774_09335 [Pedobacter sp. BS3]